MKKIVLLTMSLFLAASGTCEALEQTVNGIRLKFVEPVKAGQITRVVLTGEKRITSFVILQA